jgi:hypothetical protein
LKKNFIPASLTIGLVFAAATAGLFAKDGRDRSRFEFDDDSLVVTRAVYQGTASLVTPGEVLPPGCVAGSVTVPLIAGGTASVKVKCGVASDNGEYPNLADTHNVWNNDVTDGTFGVTAPIFLDNITDRGDLLQTLAVPTNLIVTSFSSKSELALNRSTDHRSLTLMGYVGGPGFPTGANLLDISNSNTPGVIDPTNPVKTNYFRSVLEVDADGRMSLTDGNAYSGDNGRAVIKGNSLYYMAGNDNNGGLSTAQLSTTQIGVNLVNSTGAELLVPGATPPPVPPNINKIGDFEVTQVGYTASDKPGKDDNFRGITIHHDTLYVTKGSGSNGINTVYQVGTTGELPTPSNAPGTPANLKNVPMTILPGFPTSLASGVAQDGSTGHPVMFPFGLWFADDSTLYVCDEGDGTLVASRTVNGQPNVADDATIATAGIQKWKLESGAWKLVYTLQNGLNIGVPYSIPNYPTSLNPATDGCRNITGRHNGDGTVTVFAVTSTVSTNGDVGADPNKLVKVTDRIAALALPETKSPRDGYHDGDNDNELGVITTIRSAKAGEILRGVALAPTDRDDDDNRDHDSNRGRDHNGDHDRDDHGKYGDHN